MGLEPISKESVYSTLDCMSLNPIRYAYYSVLKHKEVLYFYIYSANQL